MNVYNIIGMFKEDCVMLSLCKCNLKFLCMPDRLTDQAFLLLLNL